MKSSRALAFVALGIVLGQAPPVRAQLDKTIKAAAILFAVDRFGPDINKFVNEVTRTKDIGDEAVTKVVPILTVGNGTYAGAAQINGPRRLVDTVRAVAQMEGEKRIIQPTVRVRGLIPVSDRAVRSLETLKRVPGVGVTATLEVKL
ncbi:hypothetical protein [Armatimonas sp.]|uniref:hypothetical protein n=1 Tax=Armatimonas sp. TaxID=1872638 RepID=UPI00286A8E08|nr:hypothetical protein [Armatimonas sp.]